jgi:hypothetical protein
LLKQAKYVAVHLEEDTLVVELSGVSRLLFVVVPIEAYLIYLPTNYSSFTSLKNDPMLVALGYKIPSSIPEENADTKAENPTT